MRRWTGATCWSAQVLAKTLVPTALGALNGPSRNIGQAADRQRLDTSAMARCHHANTAAIGGAATERLFIQRRQLTRRPEMPSPSKLSGLNRFVAFVLALVWLGAGCAAIAFGLVSGGWLPVIGGFFAIVYAVLWVRVIVRSRLLSWQELRAPWRVAAQSSRSGTTPRSTPGKGSQR